jgi:hypothetical protein
MRFHTSCLLIILSWSASCASAAIGVLAQQTPQPDTNGVYTSGNGVEPAKLVHAVAAIYPIDKSIEGQKHVISLRVVIGVDHRSARSQQRVIRPRVFS